jgi:CBS domain-containing protein
MAAVLDEQAAGALWRRLEGRTAADLIAGEDEELPAIEADATLIEVASLMVRTRSSLVAVREEERVIGAITIVALLEQLLLR